jgi:hypothetical protein
MQILCRADSSECARVLNFSRRGKEAQRTQRCAEFGGR